MSWSMLTFDFWHRMVAVATVPADWRDLYSREVAWVCESYAMAKVIVCDAAMRLENAMETLRPSFRRYIVNFLNDILPKMPRVAQETDAPNTFCRLPGA